MTKLRKAFARDAGIDLIVDENVVFEPKEFKAVTFTMGNFKTPLPINTCGIIVPRSSAAKTGLLIANCPIDPGYVGKITAFVFNASNDTVYCEAGKSFCQLLILQTAADKHSDIVKLDKIGYGFREFQRLGSSGDTCDT